MSPRIPLLFLLCAFLPAGASDWSCELGFDLGSQMGTMRNKDESFYSDWLKIYRTDKSGQVTSNDPVDLSVTTWGFDLEAYKTLPSKLKVGAGFAWLHTFSEAANPGIKKSSQDMMERQAFSLRLRWLPREWPSYQSVSAIEVEPAIGLASVQMHRYGLAAAQIGSGGALDSAPEIAKAYISIANRTASSVGPQAELFVHYVSTQPSGFQYRVGLGFTAAWLNVSDDPLSSWTYQGAHYPTQLNDFGIALRLALGFKT